MATNQNIASEIEKSLPPELQTDQDGFEPGLDLSKSEIEDIIKFMKEDLGITNPIPSKK
ncbi:MAG: hypothetical protein II937_00960 [Bacteroidales bacterium]|jgi:hypothetical protein|nr:hypothetical protein [Bacteroidales bacterium]